MRFPFFCNPGLLAALLIPGAILAPPAQGQFAAPHASLPNPAFAAAAWGDYDGDGDLDLALAGQGGEGRFTSVLRNENGAFADIRAGIAGVRYGAVAWGDYNNDGKLDLAIQGESDQGPIARIYRNDAGTFVEAMELTGVQSGALAWGDFDRDGDLDLLVTGATGTHPGGFANTLTRLYQNDSGVFTAIETALPNICAGSVEWGDYDNDGDLDILLGGDRGEMGSVCAVYENNSGVFSDANIELPPFDFGRATWGDYDGDGDLDIAIAGDSFQGIAAIYRNDGGAFTDIGAGLTPVFWGSASWADLDNDGDLDLTVLGYDDIEPVSKIYLNDSGDFNHSGIALEGLYQGRAAWGDYDGDGRLDLLLIGATELDPGHSVTLYRNTTAANNTPPSPPAGLTARVSDSGVILSWNRATDAETPAAALSYNVRVGTAPGGVERKAPSASTVTGLRYLPEWGNVGQVTELTLVDLEPGVTYYWSAQTIDSALAGSAFAAEGVFAAPVSPALPVFTVHPAGQSVVEGGAATFSVTVTGAGPLSYQWRKDGNTLPGAIHSTLTIQNVTAAHAGVYTVVVSNPAGSATSLPAHLGLAFLAPTVVYQPVSQAVTEGAKVTFTVVAAGSMPMSYQWRKDTLDLPGETNASLTLTHATLEHAGEYGVRIANSGGSAISNPAHLTVAPALPTILLAPASAAVLEGAEITFSVSALGTPPLSYQWRHNGAAIPGATGASLTLPAVVMDQAGGYDVKVSNAAGSVITAPARLVVKPNAPIIITPPASRNIVEGEAVVFSVSAAGTGPLVYQWLKDGTEIKGATDATLLLGSVAYSQAGGYAVRVGNQAGSVTTAPVSLAVKPLPPRLLIGPVSQTVREGETVSLTVSATSSAPQRCQWQKAGIDIPGATNWTLTIPSVLTSDAGYYAARVSNAGGAIFTTAASLTVIGFPPVIVSGPISQMVAEGSSVSFTVVATGSSPLSYQWRKNGADLPGETNSELRIAAASPLDAGDYTVEVGNTSGSAASPPASLVVKTRPDAPHLAVTGGTSNTITLSWVTEPGGVYRLQHKADARLAEWQNLNEWVATTTSISVTLPVEGGCALFRVEVSP
jgi:hypothetical protein